MGATVNREVARCRASGTGLSPSLASALSAPPCAGAPVRSQPVERRQPEPVGRALTLLRASVRRGLGGIFGRRFGSVLCCRSLRLIRRNQHIAAHAHAAAGRVSRALPGSTFQCTRWVLAELIGKRRIGLAALAVGPDPCQLHSCGTDLGRRRIRRGEQIREKSAKSTAALAMALPWWSAPSSMPCRGRSRTRRF